MQTIKQTIEEIEQDVLHNMECPTEASYMGILIGYIKARWEQEINDPNELSKNTYGNVGKD